jgi:hypothetical protein
LLCREPSTIIGRTIRRSKSDGLSGRIVRGRVEREVADGALASLRSTKQRLEKAR